MTTYCHYEHCMMTKWKIVKLQKKDDIMDKDNITDIKNDNWEKYDDSVNKDV